MKTILLDQQDLIDFQLYGMVASYNDSTQLIYHLNRCFDTRFERSTDLDMLIDGNLIFYPVFAWEAPQTGDYYSIIRNTAYTVNHQNREDSLSSMFELTPALISGFKEYNYLLKVECDQFSEIPLTENAFIQKISKLRTEKVKFIERLIF